MVRMDEINKIRKGYFQQGETINKLATKFNRSWNTIEKIVKTPRDELSTKQKRPKRKRRVVNKEVIDKIHELMNQEKTLNVKKKQRWRPTVILNKLKEEGIYKASDRTMYYLVNEIREKRKENNKEEAFLLLEFEAGSCVQIDHGEAEVIIGNERVGGYLFVGSLPGQGIRYCQMYPVKAQEAWGSFHENLFKFLGGIFPDVIYDNDSVLVKKVLGTEHHQTDFSLGLEEHYKFSSIFCNRGAGHEKGSVENAVGFCRRNYLPGLPQYSSWSELNEYLARKCKKCIQEGKHYRTNEKLTNILSKAQQNLLPIPPSRVWAKWHNYKVNQYQIINHDNHWYSVAEIYVGSNLRVAVSVFNIQIYNNYELIVIHPRKYRQGADSLFMDHYLNQLSRKPFALWDCAAVKQNKFDPELMELWDRLYSRMDKRLANEEFIKILLLRRVYSYKDIITAIKLALLYGSVEHAGVINILKQLTENSMPRYNKNWLAEVLPELSDKSFNPTYDLSIYANLHKEV